MSKKAIESKFKVAQDSLLIQASDLSLETIASMVEQEAIDISPKYQRRSRWKIDRQSTLIESFLLNVPVPPVYLAEDDFGTYSVIDGKQRITAIHDFMRKRMRLKSLEKFTEIENCSFQELPQPLRSALTIRPYVRVVTLLKQSDPSLKYEVFTRLNKQGQPLNAQEIRNVIYRGSLNEVIYSLCKDEFLRKQLKIKNNKSPAYEKMHDAEYVLRFLTLAEVWKNFSGDLRRSMDDFMGRYQNASTNTLQKMSRRFEIAIKTCEEIWGNNAFQRPSGDGWRAQMLAGMFDAQMVAIGEISDKQRVAAIENRTKIIRDTRRLFASDSEFEQSVRQGTNTPSRIRYRVEKVLSLL